MSDFEEKLNSLLSSPESMQQITQLAQMLSGQNDAAAPPPPQPKQAGASKQSAPEAGLPGGIDMDLLNRFLPLLQSFSQHETDERQQLLYALKPFLSEARQQKIDHALHLAHLLHVGKSLFKGFGEAHV